MNEKIQQIYDTALVAAGKENQFETTHLDVAEKFAELILKECLNNMENCDGDLDFAIWKTKKHFGVE
jgi:hypothetical protein